MHDKRLKLCPFCGGEPDFIRTSIVDHLMDCEVQVVFVRCRNIRCWATTQKLEYNPKIHKNGSEYDEVAKLWNRRF